jgi:hypothetical protein
MTLPAGTTISHRAHRGHRELHEQNLLRQGYEGREDAKETTTSPLRGKWSLGDKVADVTTIWTEPACPTHSVRGGQVNRMDRMAATASGRNRGRYRFCLTIPATSL